VASLRRLFSINKFLNIDKYVYLPNMRSTMPAKAPPNPAIVTDQLAALGACIRAQRKALRVSATALAEASGMSRVSVHRIEQGEPSVTMGAYLNVLAALGMTFSATVVGDAPSEKLVDDRAGWLPARVRLADYPALKQLAWQVQGTDELTPLEALGIYERNWRHIDEAALLSRERNLIDALRLVFGSGMSGAGDV
jgi:transcriptional regulator with XRE-family HTH domain